MRFDEVAALLIELEDGSRVVGVQVLGMRVLLESGRLMNNFGHSDVAVELVR